MDSKGRGAITFLSRDKKGGSAVPIPPDEKERKGDGEGKFDW